MKLEKYRSRILKMLVSFSPNKVTVNAGVLEIHPWQIMMPHSRSFFLEATLLETALYTVQIKLP